jgi:heme exporter protein A
VAVFGPNGAGKTTLIKLAAGLLSPSAGSVRLWGQRPLGVNGAVRAHVGLVSHQSYLYDELSARENLLFYAKLYGVQSPADRVDEALAAFGLAHRARDPVRTYSRGMQQRVALARALLHDPTLLLLDEPDTGLDPSTRESLQDLLTRQRPDLTVLMATHNLEMGLGLCERAIVLVNGRLVYDSSVVSEDMATRQERVNGILLGRGQA